MTKDLRIYNKEKTVTPINGTGKTGQPKNWIVVQVH